MSVVDRFLIGYREAEFKGAARMAALEQEVAQLERSLKRITDTAKAAEAEAHAQGYALGLASHDAARAGDQAEIARLRQALDELRRADKARIAELEREVAALRQERDGDQDECARLEAHAERLLFDASQAFARGFAAAREAAAALVMGIERPEDWFMVTVAARISALRPEHENPRAKLPPLDYVRGWQDCREAAAGVAEQPVRDLTYGPCRGAYEETAARIRALRPAAQAQQETPLPSAADIIDPDFTGGLSVEEHLRRVRGRSSQETQE